MNLFETVKSQITTRGAAEFYGLKVRPNGMLCCPFHGDRHPSMKVDVRYYCFGCHETGDVIDFTCKLFHLRPLDASKNLAADFGIDPTTPAAAAVPVSAHAEQARQRQKESACVSILIDYECLLKERKARFAPSPDDNIWDIRFAEACEKLPIISELIDTLYSPDPELRKTITEGMEKFGSLESLQAQIHLWREEDRLEATASNAA